MLKRKGKEKGFLMITLQNISKTYDDKAALANINLEINDGEFLVLVGPSGSGKTTLLKMLNRLIEPTSGTIYIDGRDIQQIDIKSLRLDTGYVLQQIALFPNLSVGENIELILELKRWNKKERYDRAKELLEKVGLPADRYYKRKPTELSGGEQQRIGILRAIAANPKVILMDEPFSALDPITRKSLQQLVKDLHKEFGTTIIFVTHDVTEALLLADKICLMRFGNIVQYGSAYELKHHSKNDFVREFLSSAKLKNDKILIQDMVKSDHFEKKLLEEKAVCLQISESIDILYEQFLITDNIAIFDGDEYLGTLSKNKLALYFLERQIQLEKGGLIS